MKNLIFFAIAFLFLFTSCFETTDEVTVVPEVPTGDFDIMKCSEVTAFIEYAINNEPREPRPTLQKYKKNNVFFYRLDKGGEPFVDDQVEILIYDINCNVVCSINYGYAGGECPRDFNKDLVLIETVWQDPR